MSAPAAPIDLAAGLDAAVAHAAAALRRGDIVAIPTETFYGLAVCADDPAAVARLCALKGRAAQKALPLIAADARAVARRCFVPAPLQRLGDALWPGPLTLCLTPRESWPRPVLAGGDTLGVRVSAHPFARGLAQALATFITATSANLAGGAAVTRLADLDPALRRGALCVDGGELPGAEMAAIVQLPWLT